jgi:kynurenine formamidase
MAITLEVGDRTWRADVTRAVDISIPLSFTGDQPSFFGAPPASAVPLRAGAFTGEMRTGASCNCSTYSLTPHCNGTHTESVGHITAESHAVGALVLEGLLPAQLITVPTMAAADAGIEPDLITQPHDLLITAQALKLATGETIAPGVRALVIRTLPNSTTKRSRNYANEPGAYFTSAAMHWIVSQGIEHLVADVPSLDRGDDGGHLLCHRIFWGVPPREHPEQTIARPHATVTEFAYIPDEVSDGVYLLNLQIAPFVADAAPSRPLLYPLVSS